MAQGDSYATTPLEYTRSTNHSVQKPSHSTLVKTFLCWDKRVRYEEHFSAPRKYWVYRGCPVPHIRNKPKNRHKTRITDFISRAQKSNTQLHMGAWKPFYLYMDAYSHTVFTSGIHHISCLQESAWPQQRGRGSESAWYQQGRWHHRPIA